MAAKVLSDVEEAEVLRDMKAEMKSLHLKSIPWSSPIWILQ